MPTTFTDDLSDEVAALNARTFGDKLADGVEQLVRDRITERYGPGVLSRQVDDISAALRRTTAGRLSEALNDDTVAALRARVEALGHGPGVVGARVAAVGPATEAALRDWGVRPDLVPEVATTAALGQAFPDPPAGAGPVLLARADLANPELAVILRTKGWEPVEVVAYHTVPVGALDPAARRRLDGGEVDWVAFTASSTVEGFLRGYGGPPPPGVRVAAIGPVTADTARSAGIRVAATATDHTIGGLVAAIEHAVAGGVG